MIFQFVNTEWKIVARMLSPFHLSFRMTFLHMRVGKGLGLGLPEDGTINTYSE